MSVKRGPARWSLIALACMLLAVGNEAAWSQSTGASSGSQGAAAGSPGAAASCPAFRSWLTQPSLSFLSVDPSPPLCAFYQYAWEAFLYLTHPAPGEKGALTFETFAYVDNLAAPPGVTKTALIPGAVRFVDKRTNRTRVFRLRGKKPADAFASDQAQTQDVLYDQAGNPTYYEQFLSPTAFDFIRSCDLYLSTCMPKSTATTTASTATTTSTTTPASTTAPAWVTNLRFPPGSIEIKVSWRVLPPGTPNATTYYRVHGVTVPLSKTPVDLGLVGFHLVYATPGHPEMVWATFEHVDNAPSAPSGTCPSNGVITVKPPAGFTGWAYNSATRTNSQINCTSSVVDQPATSAPYTQAFRTNAYGSDLTMTSPTNGGKVNIETIETLNVNVRKILSEGNSVWRHYFLLGAVWTGGGLPAVAAIPPNNQPLPPNTNLNQIVAGSTLLANATMETFTQSPYLNCGKIGGPQCFSCFTCHNDKFIAAPFGVSHAVGNSVRTATCPTEQPQAWLATQKNVQPVPAHSSRP